MLPVLALASSLVLLPLAQNAPPKEPAATTPTTIAPRIRLSRVWPDLKLLRPVQMLQVPDQPDLWYLVEQTGRIRLGDMTQKDATQAPLVLDITDPVNDKMNEEGLLSVAFHPDYPKKRELYVYYTAEPPKRSVLSRFAISADGRTVDPKSEEVLLEVAQPYWNHNGGTVLFGPDGYLYLSLGDGGAANDPNDAGQDLDSLLAKVLRIDVNKKGDGKPYAIPSDNPFVSKAGARPEIWAYGLRNVWRMSFDTKTGELWAGDVGQNKFEEIDLVTKGGNYGWRLREGLHKFGPTKRESVSAPIDPVVEYPRKDGVSVTGGYVYRGDVIPNLNGVYLYADFGSGNVWGIRRENGKTSTAMTLLRKGDSLWSSFAEAKDGTLYLVSFEGGQNAGQAGAVWRIVGGE
ncbi:MAG: PQQ-dependent sugar dehydrogenase [Phycisphaerae bacterium]|nr:PQQ-dependent sugar dehydrogenase [Phycisphaerae bacterium]